MAAPIYRDEFEHRMEDLFVRSVEYTNSVLDVQRIKTARQVVQEIDVTFGKWANGVSREIADLRQRQDNVEQEVKAMHSLLRRIAEGLNIDLI
jgi:hypothetical protein